MNKKGLSLKFFRVLRSKQDHGESNTRSLHVHHSGHQHRHGRGSESSDGEIPLSHCREGDHLVIQHIHGGGPLRRRLLEMGMNPGTVVRVIKYAPLKDPLECEIKGYHIALRVSEAGAIFVTLLES